jgi:putative zinc finger/helix-turn-helix YgiT family protein
MIPALTNYHVSATHDGRQYNFDIPDLELPTCRACGESVISSAVDERIQVELRKQAGLLLPSEIRRNCAQLGVTQKAAASDIGVAEATFSRWATGSVIQSRAMDRLLRLYFQLPEVRKTLAAGIDILADVVLSEGSQQGAMSMDESYAQFASTEQLVWKKNRAVLWPEAA